MRVDVKKMLFIGTENQIDAFFLQAQELGLIQFISHDKEKVQHPSSSAADLIEAIKILRSLPTDPKLFGA